jgi:hypothetical protein
MQQALGEIGEGARVLGIGSPQPLADGQGQPVLRQCCLEIGPPLTAKQHTALETHR